tara:strand:+ start:325 stop:1017 length:693 start_codon:yes stop_codon:yes gene_type:complete
MRHKLSILIKNIKNQYIFYDKDSEINIEDPLLSKYFMNNSKANITTLNSGKWIKKHYLRKGLMSPLKDLYLNTKVKNSRSYLEFNILNYLTKNNFPTIKPIAGWITKNNFMYTADLISEYIPSVTLKEYIIKSKIMSKDWYSIGILISRMHKLNVFHGDLNITNILVGKNREFYIIDFDKSIIQSSISSSHRNLNFKRLLRSIEKNNLKSYLDTKMLYKGYLDNYQLNHG